MRKRLWNVVPIGAMIASLIGCGGGAGTESVANTNAAGEAGTTAGETGAIAAAGSAASGDTAKIGTLTDRSSAAVAMVAWAEIGAGLTIQEINGAGGVNGKQVELVYRDTGSDSANVTQKSTRLAGEGVVVILGPKPDGEASTGAQWAKIDKFPMVTPCTMNTRVTIENASHYMFSCGFNTRVIANMNTKYVEEQGYKSAYFIGNDGGASGDSRDFFYEYLGDGYTNMGSSQIASSATGLSNTISSIVGRDSGVIIDVVVGPNFTSSINQGQQLGLWDMCNYLGRHTCDSTNTISLADAGNYPYGKVYDVDLWPSWLNDIEGNDKLAENHDALGQKSYKQDILPSDMGYTWYIGITAICEALKTTDDWSSEGVTTALGNVKFNTIYGEGTGSRDFDYVMNHAYCHVTAVKDTTGKWKIPVGDIYKVYTAEEVLPTKEQMQGYASKNGLTLTDLSILK